MLAAPNALIITGGATTVIDALEVLPVQPLAEVTWVLLFFTPPVVPVTFTETVQEAAGKRVAALRLTEEDPLTAVAVPEQPLHRVRTDVPRAARDKNVHGPRVRRHTQRRPQRP